MLRILYCVYDMVGIFDCVDRFIGVSHLRMADQAVLLSIISRSKVKRTQRIGSVQSVDTRFVYP